MVGPCGGAVVLVEALAGVLAVAVVDLVEVVPVGDGSIRLEVGGGQLAAEISKR